MHLTSDTLTALDTQRLRLCCLVKGLGDSVA